MILTEVPGTDLFLLHPKDLSEEELKFYFKQVKEMYYEERIGCYD